jgi:hypothetical protein
VLADIPDQGRHRSVVEVLGAHVLNELHDGIFPKWGKYVNPKKGHDKCLKYRHSFPAWGIV